MNSRPVRKPRHSRRRSAPGSITDAWTTATPSTRRSTRIGADPGLRSETSRPAGEARTFAPLAPLTWATVPAPVERPPRPVVGPGGSGPLDLRHHQQRGRDRSGEAEGEGERTPRPGPAAGDHRAGEERHVHLEGAAEARAAEAGQRGEPEVEQRPPGEEPRRRPVARHRDAQRRQDDREEPRRVDERVRRHLPGRGRRRRGGEDAVLQVAAADQGQQRARLVERHLDERHR